MNKKSKIDNYVKYSQIILSGENRIKQSQLNCTDIDFLV